MIQVRFAGSDQDRVISRYQNIQDQIKTAPVEVKLQLIFLITVFAVHLGQSCG